VDLEQLSSENALYFTSFTMVWAPIPRKWLRCIRLKTFEYFDIPSGSLPCVLVSGVQQKYHPIPAVSSVSQGLPHLRNDFIRRSTAEGHKRPLSLEGLWPRDVPQLIACETRRHNR